MPLVEEHFHDDTADVSRSACYRDTHPSSPASLARVRSPSLVARATTVNSSGEVGSEGGSYGDAAAQKATREGGVPRLEDAEDADEPTPRPGEVAGANTPSPDEPEDGVHSKSPKRQQE